MGHPLGSGSLAVDYSVVAESMFALAGGRALTAAPRADVQACMALAHAALYGRPSSALNDSSAPPTNIASGGNAEGAGGAGGGEDWCRGLPESCCNVHGATHTAGGRPHLHYVEQVQVGLALDAPSSGPPLGRVVSPGRPPPTWITCTSLPPLTFCHCHRTCNHVEQLVLFSSLAHYLDNPLLLYQPYAGDGDGADDDGSGAEADTHRGGDGGDGGRGDVDPLNGPALVDAGPQRAPQVRSPSPNVRPI